MCADAQVESQQFGKKGIPKSTNCEVLNRFQDSEPVKFTKKISCPTCLITTKVKY